MTQDIFIKRVIKKFGDKFGVSNISYKTNNEEIDIICPEHGVVNVIPSTFLKEGCPLCKKEKNINIKRNKFIQKAIQIHGDKYDYSKVEYKGTITPVTIICPEHGEFQQKPTHHLLGCGCPKCGLITGHKKRILTTERWIEIAKSVHGDKYDYSETVYKGNDEKVYIVCLEHGGFWQKASAHTSRKSGCPKCGENKSKKLGYEIGINTLKKIKEEIAPLYDIKIETYVNQITPIKVICKKHGEFEVLPNRLKTYKTPCPYCREELKKPQKEKINWNEVYFNNFKKQLEEVHPNRYSFEKCEYKSKDEEIILYDKVINEYITVKPSLILKSNFLERLSCYKKTKLPTLKFINKAIEKHGDKYDYSKTIYINNKQKVCIICKEHGEFWQTPSEHLKGCGCGQCANNIKWELEDYINTVKKIHGNKYDYSKVVLGKQCEHITLVCPEHGDFRIRAMHHLRGSGCPKCVGSSGEKILLSFFENKNLFPHYNKYYKWLDNLQLDFYFPEYKLAVEVQGEQHFIETDFFERSLSEQIKYDEKKKILCEKNNITLLYYAPYEMDFPYHVYTNVDELYEKIKCIIDSQKKL